ncbi:MAG TPA: hypothetical protein DCS07_13670 [Bdellovibrionales bacterium]|nr:MAG: hypothetical protein A2Z97_11680 [Bdellovibrionales bacterium GWB1_52_6]OFZ05377.1 MAG: hypothetical protein A2X97_16670 [Bdellovibrionales bacterium GWA1_52_35]OFZ43081.1 MAG: hypothetical protein A2070_01610 [Bdellovibrionales bacterium GWC1_52_8]HAR43657.1 hypothetical protein [Bdellovibrionales bacterium]HCM38979.1 hypothetical protein [Bdellovibrionales bacterium]
MKKVIAGLVFVMALGNANAVAEEGRTDHPRIGGRVLLKSASPEEFARGKGTGYITARYVDGTIQFEYDAIVLGGPNSERVASADVAISVTQDESGMKVGDRAIDSNRYTGYVEEIFENGIAVLRRDGTWAPAYAAREYVLASELGRGIATFPPSGLSVGDYVLFNGEFRAKIVEIFSNGFARIRREGAIWGGGAHHIKRISDLGLLENAKVSRQRIKKIVDEKVATPDYEQETVAAAAR